MENLFNPKKKAVSGQVLNTKMQENPLDDKRKNELYYKKI